MRHVVLLFLGFALQIANAAEFHVSPGGSPEGDGSEVNPWDLATAFAHPASVQAGDTIWLHGGTYRGTYESRLKGTANAPITVRQAPGERATIALEKSGKLGVALWLRGEHVRYQGFEVTCLNPVRRTETPGSWPQDLRRGSVEIRGSHQQLLNLVIHDLGNAIGFWSEAEGGEINGCLIFNNGWDAPDRAHGHAIYTQNEKGTKRIIDNILFNQFRNGLALYGSHKATLRGYRIEGNVSFNNGAPAGPNRAGRNLLAGGGAPLEDIEIINNFTWGIGGGLQIGYPWGKINKSTLARGNYVRGVSFYQPGNLTFRENTVFDLSTVILAIGEETKIENLDIDANSYHWKKTKWNPFATSAAEGNSGMKFEGWQGKALDVGSTFSTAMPAENRVFVRPNQHVFGRGHVIVYNWEKRDEVLVDLSPFLKTDQAFRVVSAQNFYGPPLIRGVFDGKPVGIPILPGPRMLPLGLKDVEIAPTEPDFAVFVVLPE